jgi:hypothetical protein
MMRPQWSRFFFWFRKPRPSNQRKLYTYTCVLSMNCWCLWRGGILFLCGSNYSATFPGVLRIRMSSVPQQSYKVSSFVLFCWVTQRLYRFAQGTRYSLRSSRNNTSLLTTVAPIPDSFGVDEKKSDYDSMPQINIYLYSPSTSSPFVELCDSYCSLRFAFLNNHQGSSRSQSGNLLYVLLARPTCIVEDTSGWRIMIPSSPASMPLSIALFLTSYEFAFGIAKLAMYLYYSS